MGKHYTTGFITQKGIKKDMVSGTGMIQLKTSNGEERVRKDFRKINGGLKGFTLGVRNDPK